MHDRKRNGPNIVNCLACFAAGLSQVKIGVLGFEYRLIKLTMHSPWNINQFMVCHKSSFMFPTCEAEILHTTTNMKASTSEGYDNISTKLLKQTLKEVATPLAHIVNLSLSQGIFPNDMKLAKIVPIFKNGNTKLFNNYRPISILPAFSKILEK